MFIVIEGIDGAGCETQAKNLKKFLEKDSIPYSFLKYPDYDRNIGKVIREFLYQNKDLTAQNQFLLYSLQFLFDKEQISKDRKNKVVIADRYFTTTLCFQTLAGVKMGKALRFADDFGIEKPDLVFYINVRSDVAIQRKAGEDKEKNRNEKDFELTKRTYTQYEKMVKDQVWTKWVDINGEREIDEITQDIYNKIKRWTLSS
jgi:dTMP kinase